MTNTAVGPATGRGQVLGIPINTLSMEEVINEIERWIAAEERKYVCIADVHALLEAVDHDDLYRIYNEAGLVTPDGMPLVWRLRRTCAPAATRVCGPDLLPAVLRRSSHYRHFFYGSSEATLTLLTQRVARDFTSAEIVGTHSPPYRDLNDLERSKIVQLINDAAPDIVWVGLGAPKQERWMAAHRPMLNAPVLVGVGAAFDVLAGTVRRAPRVLQDAGLEWAYRVTQEPRRLARRYLLSNSRFVALAIADDFRRKLRPAGQPPVRISARADR